MSLRAILSGSRVKKKSPVKKTTAPSASTKAKAASLASRPQNSRPGSGRGSTADISGNGGEYDEDGDIFGAADAQDFDDDDDFKLDDSGLVASLADDLSLRDVVQALRYSRGNMFDPVPGLTSAGPDEPGEYDLDHMERPHQTPRSMAGGHRQKGYVGNSTRIADLLNMRRRMPALATTAHITALLPNATATERETVALVRAGMIRKVVQPQWRQGMAASVGGPSGSSGGSAGGGPGGSPSKGAGDARYRKALAIGGESLGEVLVETAELQKLVQASSSLATDTKAAFSQWLGGASAGSSTVADSKGGNLKKFTINSSPAPQLTAEMVDELVRGGFLVGHGARASLVGSVSLAGHRSAGARGSSSGRGSQIDTGDVYARPEDRTTLLSLETVAKAASGSFDAVGGVGAVYTAGGGGARAALPGRRRGAGGAGGGVTTVEDLLLAVPGHGLFIKIVSGALAYLVGILARTSYRETLESSLRERWDAGGNITKSVVGAGGSGMGFRGFKRVPLSRTRKWKDFYGMSFDWVLAEALGAGLVELFDTGSVGRGVRLLA